METVNLEEFVISSGGQVAAAVKLGCTQGNINHHLRGIKKGVNQVLISLDGDKVTEAVIVKGFNGSDISMDYRPVFLKGA